MEARDEDIEQRHPQPGRAVAQDRFGHPQEFRARSDHERDEPANTIIRDSLNGSFSQIAVDDQAMFNEIRNYIREIEPRRRSRQVLPGQRAHLRQFLIFPSRSSRSSPEMRFPAAAGLTSSSSD